MDSFVEVDLLLLVAATFGRSSYILDDYSALRAVSEEMLEASEVELFAPREAWWYIPKRTLGRDEKASQGEAFFTAPNPPFGATFTYYLKDSLETAEDVRTGEEAEIAEEGGDTPYPGFDALREEELEEAPAILLTVTDASGEVVRRLTGPATAGVHRVSWDLRYPSPRAWSEDWSDDDASGVLVTPGTYTVSLAQRSDGVVTDLGESRTVDVVQLRERGLGGASPAEVVAFLRELDAFTRRADAAGRALEQAENQLDAMRQALMRSTVAGSSLDDRALRAGFATSEEDEVRPSRRVSVSVDLEPRSWPGATTARLVPRDSDDGATAPIAPPLHGRAAGYATVLRQVAGGRTAEAARDLMELERTAADDGGALPRLARVQWATLSALGLGDAADREVGSPVAGSSFGAPVFLLHFERIEAYRAEGRTSLADHSAEISRRLALEMARAGDDRALTLLAGDLLRRGRPRTSQDLLRRGLAMGPASADARLLLAMALELEGRYREAVDTLRELLRLQPDHPEARLRLGVNLGRTGKPRRGRELLRRLAEESPPRWIGVVAAQQSALTDLDDRPRAVVPPLREDWVRHDRDQGLGVLLAYALERTGDGTASTQLVESIVWSGRDPSGLSPRVRYARWSAASRLRLERALRERATVERAELAARLGASVPGAATPGEGS